MEGVVTCRLFCKFTVVLDDLADAASAMLAGERHNGCRATTERRDGRTVPVTNRCQTVGGSLFDMCVAIDAARGNHQAGGVDVGCSWREAASWGDRLDLAAIDPQVCQLDTLLRDNATIPDRQLVPGPIKRSSNRQQSGDCRMPVKRAGE